VQHRFGEMAGYGKYRKFVHFLSQQLFIFPFLLI
jgi:hypothetical protein